MHNTVMLKCLKELLLEENLKNIITRKHLYVKVVSSNIKELIVLLERNLLNVINVVKPLQVSVILKIL